MKKWIYFLIILVLISFSLSNGIINDYKRESFKRELLIIFAAFLIMFNSHALFTWKLPLPLIFGINFVILSFMVLFLDGVFYDVQEYKPSMVLMGHEHEATMEMEHHEETTSMPMEHDH